MGTRGSRNLAIPNNEGAGCRCTCSQPWWLCAKLLGRRHRDKEFERSWCLRSEGAVLIDRLRNANPDQRYSELLWFAELKPGLLAEHASTIVKQLGDEALSVHGAAKQIPSALEPASLAEQANTIRHDLLDQDPFTRWLALESLGSLEPTLWSKHRGAIVQRLQDDDPAVRQAAVNLLIKLEPAMLEMHASAISELLLDSTAFVQKAAADALAKLEPERLACLVKWPPSPDIDDTLLHLSAKCGSFDFCCKLLEAGGPLDTRNSNGDTALHLAAQSGHLGVCQLLVRSGALFRLKNRQRNSPMDLAQRANHTDLIKWFGTLDNIATMSVGTGDALGVAMVDTRFVTEVEWFTVAMHGIRRILGIQHSLLKVRVGSGSDSHIYVLERSNEGDLVSHWQDVQPSVTDGPLHRLQVSNNENESDFKSHTLTMRALRDEALKLGDYDVAHRNCHHAALEVYNACAKDKLFKLDLPNYNLTLFAEALQVVGIDVVNFGSSQQHLGSSTSNPSTSHSYEPGIFRIDVDDADCRNYKHRHADTCASLSNWIYADNPDPKTLAAGLKLECIELKRDGHPVQWAAITNFDSLFITFMGTDDTVDIIKNLHYSTYDEAPHGLRVHSGLWVALHQRESHVSSKVRTLVSQLHSSARICECETGCCPAGRALRKLCKWSTLRKRIVLCGHSLGGGYALLTALDLLHENSENMVGLEVVTFGSPQVVVPDCDSRIWKRLDSITTLYIHAFDAVPRLPSCRAWVLDIIPQVACAYNSSGPSQCGVDLKRMLPASFQTEAERAVMAGYGTVGTLMFIQKGSRFAMCVPTSEKATALLGEVPKPVGRFIVDQHLMCNYEDVIVNLKSS